MIQNRLPPGIPAMRRGAQALGSIPLRPGAGCCGGVRHRPESNDCLLGDPRCGRRRTGYARASHRRPRRDRRRRITSVRMRWVMACAISSSGERVWIVARRKLLIPPRISSWRPRSGSSGRPAARAARGSGGRGRGRPRRRRGRAAAIIRSHTRQEVALDPRASTARGHSPHHEPLEHHTRISGILAMVTGGRRAREPGRRGVEGGADEPLVLELRERLAYRDVAYSRGACESVRSTSRSPGSTHRCRSPRAGDLRPHRPCCRYQRGWSGDGIELPGTDGIRYVTAPRAGRSAPSRMSRQTSPSRWPPACHRD